MGTTSVQEWKPTALYLPSILGFLGLIVGCLAGVIALVFLSQTQNGIAIVEETFAPLGTDWKLSLWTVLPSLSVQLLSIWWTSIAEAVASRQPYVELHSSKPEGSTASRTIQLDYQSTPELLRWHKAFKLRHWLIGSQVLTSLLLGCGTSFASSLLVSRTTIFQKDIRVRQPYAFDPITSFDGNKGTIMDVFSAVRFYGASRLPWTNEEYAFTPFYATNGDGNASITANTTLTFPTQAFSAYLDCRLIGPDAYVKKEPTEGSLEFIGVDRGCQFTYRITLQSAGQTLLDTTAYHKCGLMANYGRLIFTYGLPELGTEDLVSNLTVVSCISGYFNTTGNLTVRPSADLQNGEPSFVSFFAGERNEINKELVGSDQFEGRMTGLEYVDAESVWSTSKYGQLVLLNGGRILGEPNTNDRKKITLTTEILLQSIKEVFTGVFATAIGINGFSKDAQSSVDELTGGVMEFTTDRLFTVPWVVMVLCFSFSSTMVVAGWTAMHVMRTKTLLTEEPAGLLSIAGLLQGSDLNAMADEVKSGAAYSGKFCDDAIKGDGLDANSKWVMENGQGVDGLRPRIIRLKSK